MNTERAVKSIRNSIDPGHVRRDKSDNRDYIPEKQ